MPPWRMQATLASKRCTLRFSVIAPCCTFFHTLSTTRYVFHLCLLYWGSSLPFNGTLTVLHAKETSRMVYLADPCGIWKRITGSLWWLFKLLMCLLWPVLSFAHCGSSCSSLAQLANWIISISILSSNSFWMWLMWWLVTVALCLIIGLV